MDPAVNSLLENGCLRVWRRRFAGVFMGYNPRYN